jgi:hypothetical protein
MAHVGRQAAWACSGLRAFATRAWCRCNAPCSTGAARQRAGGCCARCRRPAAQHPYPHATLLAANEYTSFNQCCRDSFNRAANVPILGNGMTSFDCYAATKASAVNNSTSGGLRAAATQQQQQQQQKVQGRRMRLQ